MFAFITTHKAISNDTILFVLILCLTTLNITENEIKNKNMSNVWKLWGKHIDHDLVDVVYDFK